MILVYRGVVENGWAAVERTPGWAEAELSQESGGGPGPGCEAGRVARRAILCSPGCIYRGKVDKDGQLFCQDYFVYRPVRAGHVEGAQGASSGVRHPAE